MIGDFVYLLTSTPVYNYYYSNETVIPRVFSNNKLIKYCEGRLRCPDMYYIGIPYENYNMVNVAAIDIKNDSKMPESDIYLLSGAENLFVSEKNMYVSHTRYLDQNRLYFDAVNEVIVPKLEKSYRERVKMIQDAHEYVLTEDEKLAKIGNVVMLYLESISDEESEKLMTKTQDLVGEMYEALRDEAEKSVIHRIALDGANIEYRATGEVKGQLLNQFSLDEKDGNLRVATTRNREWGWFSDEEGEESYNNLYVLDADLKQIGALENLASGERIYSARFIGDRAYMVTYRQVDPLFVIDLAVATAPRVAGEIKLPGFSNYLHPYDEFTLIGLGRETEEDQTTGIVRDKGIKLSLFDVSSISEPKVIDEYVLGDNNSYTQAAYEHKAFLFSASKNLLAFPVSMAASKEEGKEEAEAFNGLAVFKLDKNGFEYRGKFDHADPGDDKEDYWWGDYDKSVNRSLYINDMLYSFSNNYMQVNRLDDLGLVKKVGLKPIAEKIEVEPKFNW
jgi:uncharacterized secreted protein with C-terminal beta-propeller domain